MERSILAKKEGTEEPKRPASGKHKEILEEQKKETHTNGVKQGESNPKEKRHKDKKTIRAAEQIAAEKHKGITDYFLTKEALDASFKGSMSERGEVESEEDYQTNEEIIRVKEEKQMMEKENMMLTKDRIFYKKELERLAALNQSFKMKNDILLKKRQATENITETFARNDSVFLRGAKKTEERVQNGPKAKRTAEEKSKGNGPEESEEPKNKRVFVKNPVLSENESDEEGRLDLHEISKIKGSFVFGSEFLAEVFFKPDKESLLLKKPRLVPLAMLLQNESSRKLAQDFLAREYQVMEGSLRACIREAVEIERESKRDIENYKSVIENLINNYSHQE